MRVCGLSFLIFILILSISYGSKQLSDKEWLKVKDDIEPLANHAMKELKRTSSIHLFDDLQLIEIVEHKKTIAGYSRSLYLKLRVSSNYFRSEEAEELLSVLVLQHKQNHKYSFAIPDYPVMKESYIHSLEEKWADIHREQRDKRFEELQQYASSDSFENQDYIVK